MAGFKTHPIKLTFASLAAGMLFVSCGKKHEASSALKQNVTNAVSNPQISKPGFSDLFPKAENLSQLSEGERSDVNGFLHLQKQWENKEFIPLEIPEVISLSKDDIKSVAKLL
ncbi:MAG: hypothetical protein ABIQ35_11220, partial [Verrucomicrobiota bacterium]